MHFLKSSILILIIVSCSPQKRLNKLIAKHPNLIELDTLIVRDTIVVESYNYDTITTFRYSDTTIIVNSQKVLARYYFDTLRQEIWHEIECKEDTIFYEKLVPYEKIVIKELTWWQKWRDVIIIIIILLLGLFIFKKISKFFI